MTQRTKRVLDIKGGKIEIREEELTKEAKETNQRFLESINLASDLGFTIALPIVGGAVLGSILDQKLNQSPKFTLSLIFLGLFISFYNIYKLTKKK